MRFWNWPNTLTMTRIFVIPAFVACFFIPFDSHRYVAALIFLLAAVTDWLDGFLARYLKQTSPFGAFLDPVADKLMVASALVLLAAQYGSFWVTVAGIIIVAREIAVSALREWMAELGKRATVKVSSIGKVKTTVQMVAVLMLLSQPPVYNGIVIVGIWGLYIAVILTLWSMCIYLQAAYREIKDL